MNATSLSSSPLRSLESLLRVDRSVPLPSFSALEWVAVIRRGIPASIAISLANSLRITPSELAAALNIPARTLAYRRKNPLLNSEESAKLVRLARVIERGGEVFEDIDTAIDWMKSPNAALDGLTPLSLLDTDIGGESVMDTLGRIEHGVFA